MPLYAKYTIAFKTFLDDTDNLSWFNDTIVMSTDTRSTSLKTALMAQWNIYEISGQTIGEFKQFLSSSFNEHLAYYEEMLDQYEKEVDFLEGAIITTSDTGSETTTGSRDATKTDKKTTTRLATNDGTTTEVIDRTTENDTTVTGTNKNTKTSANSGSLETIDVDLPNKQVSASDYYAYPSSVNKQTDTKGNTTSDNGSTSSITDGTITDKANNSGTNKNTLNDSITEDDTISDTINDSGSKSTNNSRTMTDKSKLIALRAEYLSQIRNLYREFALRFTDCFIHVFD